MESPVQRLIVIGAGCFGLSTALELSRDEAFAQTHITVISVSEIPDKNCSSFDINRIVRTDYTSPLYASLAGEALEKWRHSDWGKEGRFAESGLLMLGEAKDGYIASALDLARTRGQEENIAEVEGEDAIREACTTGGRSGNWGYLNHHAGWTDAARSLEYAYDELKKLGRAKIVTGTVSSLLVEKSAHAQSRVTGVKLEDDRTYSADLTVLAAGAKSPMLIDMRGIAVASGEVLAYMALSPEDSNRLRSMPAIISLSKGWFIIPPNGNELKIARHGQGFLNSRHFSHPQINGDVELSIPSLGSHDEERMLESGLGACREALEELIPWLAKREFDRTRICWYTDTTKGDFIIDYHPSFDGLFLATGGSGHAFKFMPVIGRRIVDAIQRKLDTGYRQLWSWPEQRIDAAPVDVQQAAFKARGGYNK